MEKNNYKQKLLEMKHLNIEIQYTFFSMMFCPQLYAVIKYLEKMSHFSLGKSWLKLVVQNNKENIKIKNK